MQRRTFLKTAATLALLPHPPANPAPKKRPNFLFLFADDHTYEAIGALGLTNIQTPNLDRLVQNGTTFTRAYNQGGWHGAICTASRGMLLTGRFLWNAEKAFSDPGNRPPVWPELLAQVGYDTYMTSKWDIEADLEPDQCFQHIGEKRSVHDAPPIGFDRPREGRPDPWKPWRKDAGDYWKTGKHDSEEVRDEAIHFLDQAATRDNPFFMYLAFNAPHDPRQSPKEYLERYPLDTIDLPENFLPQYPDKDAIGSGTDLRDERLAPFPRTEYAIKVHRQEYYAIITHLDTQIGHILDALEASDHADNTYVFFAGDNGLALGHHGLMGKQNLYEHSIRVPLLITGPTIPENKKIATPVYLQDIMPTTLELASTPTPSHIQFKSLLPLIQGKRKKNYDAIYGAYKNLQRTIIKGNYKLICYPTIDKTLLFDLNNDPDEMTNLAQNKQYANKLAELKRDFPPLQRIIGDTLSLP